jgi:hypothetical protein
VLRLELPLRVVLKLGRLDSRSELLDRIGAPGAPEDVDGLDEKGCERPAFASVFSAVLSRKEVPNGELVAGSSSWRVGISKE